MAVTTPLYNIGEQVYQLSPEFKASFRSNLEYGRRGCATGWWYDYDGINWTSSSKSCLRIWSPL